MRVLVQDHGGTMHKAANLSLIVWFLARALVAGAADRDQAGYTPPSKQGEPGSERRVLVTISKGTTVITTPLRNDGYPNYVAAINQHLSQGVTPENNAAVPLFKALGPAEIPPPDRDAYCRALGVPRLPDQGDYYVPFHLYIETLKDARKPASGDGGKRPRRPL